MRLSCILSNDPHSEAWHNVYNRVDGWSSKPVLDQIEAALSTRLNRFYHANFRLRIASNRSDDA